MTDVEPRARVVRYLDEIARTIPELGLSTADVDGLAHAMDACRDVDTTALHQDSAQLRGQVARLRAVPAALNGAARTLPSGFTGDGGDAAFRRIECVAALADTDLVSAVEIADVLSAAATGIDAIRTQLDRRVDAVDVMDAGGQSIAALRAALDNGDVTQSQLAAWTTEVRAIVDYVDKAAADTRSYVESILGIVTSAFTPIAAASYPDRIAAMQRTETVGTATILPDAPSGMDVLDAVLRVATAVGAITENVVTSIGAAVEAAAAVASIPAADSADAADEEDEADPDSGHDDSVGAVPDPTPEVSESQPPVPSETESAPVLTEPIPEINPAGDPAPEPPPAPPEESGLALLGDS